MAQSAPHHVLRHLRRFAESVPERLALVSPSARVMPYTFNELSYLALDQRTDQLAHGFVDIGIQRGVKTVLMLQAGEELFVVLLALLKVGAVPIVVDPGMGLRRMLHCYREVGAEAFIGLPLAHMVRTLRPAAFSSIKVNVTSGRWGGVKLNQLYRQNRGPFELPPVDGSELTMLIFTTGSTGPAKGVEYTHGMIDALLEQMLAVYPVIDGERGLVTLPLFTLTDLLSGCTAVLAPMDPTRPARVVPENIISAIEKYGIRHMFGSPALLNRLAPAAVAQPERLASLQTVVCGGASASVEVLTAIASALPPEAVLHTTYGATEALPISTIELSTLQDGRLARSRSGGGVCVGKPLPNVRLRILTISDEPIAEWRAELEVTDQQIGEVLISGPVVSTRYHRNDEANALHKISDGDTIWHRTGDLGRVDDDGSLWLCGRKSHTVHTVDGPLYTLQCEQLFNAHDAVYRTALVGVGPRGKQTPLLCVQLVSATSELDDALRRELEQIAQRHPFTRNIKHFLAHPDFPVDIRHNAKIKRGELAVWAGATLDLIKVPRAPLAVMAIPIVGWLYLLLGLFWQLPHPALVVLWWVVLFLHVVVHPLQIIKGLPVARRVGHSTLYIGWMTTIFGATYWRALEQADATVLR